MLNPNPAPPPPPEEDKPDDGKEESGGTGTAMALDEGKIAPADLDLFTLTDDIDEAAATILKRHEARLEALRSQAQTEQALKKAEARAG